MVGGHCPLGRCAIATRVVEMCCLSGRQAAAVASKGGETIPPSLQVQVKGAGAYSHLHLTLFSPQAPLPSLISLPLLQTQGEGGAHSHLHLTPSPLPPLCTPTSPPCRYKRKVLELAQKQVEDVSKVVEVRHVVGLVAVPFSLACIHEHAYMNPLHPRACIRET